MWFGFENPNQLEYFILFQFISSNALITNTPKIINKQKQNYQGSPDYMAKEIKTNATSTPLHKPSLLSLQTKSNSKSYQEYLKLNLSLNSGDSLISKMGILSILDLSYISRAKELMHVKVLTIKATMNLRHIILLPYVLEVNSNH